VGKRKEEQIDLTPPLEMETYAEASGESAKGNSSGEIDDKSATTEECSEDEISEDEDMSEGEIAKWAYIERQVVDQLTAMSDEEEMDNYRRGWESVWAHKFGSFEQESESLFELNISLLSLITCSLLSFLPVCNMEKIYHPLPLTKKKNLFSGSFSC
jgi:hypothetical protein